MASLADTSQTRAELRQLAILLVLDAVFYFAVIPAGIVDPDGFGLDQGLPPSFSARLVAILAAVLMILRCAQLMFAKPFVGDAPEPPTNEQTEIDVGPAAAPAVMPVRGLAGIGAALIFAYGVVPVIGFFPAGFMLLVVVLALLGERRPLKVLLPSAIVTALIWVLFEQVLSIRMPQGMLFSG